MSVRTELLRFLREPANFAATADDPQVWLNALENFVEPALAKPGEYPLRPAQITAWRGLANARAGLVLGPPGTGKTHLLAWLILGYIHARVRAGLSCRVYVTAFTRNAIGNLLDSVSARRDKAWLDGPQVWFFGNKPEAGVAPNVRVQDRLYGDGLDDAFSVLNASAVVVGGSVWSLYRLLAAGRAPNADGLTGELFDLICIDEASQLVLSHGLLALAGMKSGGRVVVAGDDRQLPPIRAGRNVTLDNRELGGSLYSFMASAGAPEFRLNETFRLNGPLAQFPEASFYPGEYRSAEPNEVLALQPGWRDGLEDWEQAVIAPDLPLCVLLHDGPAAATSNPFEAHLAARLAELLEPRLDTGAFWADGLAVISPHRAQNASIRSLLPTTLRRGAFVDTVDKIQGKERDAVILSYTVADAEFALAEAEFIFSPERLNVAITRARRKLIVLISRRLLDAVPGDQDLMDKAERLREFVFGCAVIGERTLPDGRGGSVRVEIRARGFQEPAVLADPPLPAEPSLPDLTAAQLAMLAAVQKIALADRRNGAGLRALGQTLARRDNLLPDLVVLHHAGHITLSEPRSGFWVARPLDGTRTVYTATTESVRARIAQVVMESRSGPFAPFYWRVRDRFAWMNARGEDILLPILLALAFESVVTIRDSERGLTIDIPATASPPPTAADETLPEISDDDFEVLNALENAEASRINFGVFESWTSAATLADEMHRDRTKVSAAIGRLAADGWVLLAEEGRVRSRMAELAREIRYAKQRFAAGDAARRPYVVRSLKVEVRDRDKPHRGQSVAGAFAAISAGLAPEEQLVLEALHQTLEGMWGTNAAIAGFQARGLESLLTAWGGQGPQSFVIAADTGSGKTEAALLPLITAAAADRLRGLRGVRAVLAYPRTRLAANQAQRIAGYLAALSRRRSMPTVTMGLQFAQVPRTFAVADEAAGWRRQANGVWSFPLFGCPACDRELLAHEAEGVEGADSLRCIDCGWRYDGWIGTKAGLMRTPPNFFLPTTDSLHQWLHASHYGSLFGDKQGWAPPRAILADEIHLYSHVHGAQVGYTLRRLAARCARNSGGGKVLAIGMSATLGDPATAWSRLIGREDVQPISPNNATGERQANPKGREYYYFVQPEAESRGQDISGASTTVQSFMCLAHGMRRRTGRQGGYRGLVFLDSIDKVRRLHAVYQDAEEIKRLASFRTRYYPDDPVTGQPRTNCCREPHGCEIFRDGECWWFAANDSRQVGAVGLRRRDWPLTVAPQPVTAGTIGRVEALIRRSDVVFATSSLEVGYDDPDISLVYQQYAPQNLASFIQRKGRGGRGINDRPVTGVTLSLYSARDSWWFRRPSEMVNPTGFDTPLNPSNHFVRRGQVLSAMLDGAARFAAMEGSSPLLPGGKLVSGALAEAEMMVREVFREPVWLEFGAADLEQLWTHALERARPGHRLETLADIRIAVGWIPNFLFENVNLPQLQIVTPEDQLDAARREDISLALYTAAPGNATRRFDSRAVHWRPPTQGLGPWFDAADYRSAQRVSPFAPGALLNHLPSAVRPSLAGLRDEVVRPLELRLETLGVMQGSGWTSAWAVAPDGLSVVRTNDPAADPRRVQHESRSSLRGFPVIKPDPALALPAQADVGDWLAQLDSFVGQSVGGRLTGLAMARLFWGADAELRMQDRTLEPAFISQTFSNTTGTAPTLHGYHVQTEGVQFRLDTSRVDDFIAAEVEYLTENQETRRWHAGQMLRYMVEESAQAIGINVFEARRGADLFVSAASDPALRPRLLEAIRFWDGGGLARLLEDVRARRLSQHPLMTQTRVARVAATLADRRLQPAFQDAIRAAESPDRFSAWLRSCLLNGLAARLKDLFVHLGRGDDRQVIGHVRLPVQFDGEIDDVITVCEAGAYGDGTTRAFVERIGQVSPEWVNDFLGLCPNAEEDALIRAALGRRERHAEWRRIDPNDPTALMAWADELGQTPDQPLPASLLRIFFDAERIGGERIELYDLAIASDEAETCLRREMGRQPSAWEHVSAVVASAEAEPTSPPGRLLAAYGALEDASQEGSLSAASRLADQVYRLGAHLCVDGCQACVHHSSDLMSETMAEASTSRRLLQRFLVS
ncbi:hypothetical protein ABIE71_002236 [Bradyrhizobium diazoefficiens]